MTFQAFRFDPVELPPVAKALRKDVRAFLDDNRASLGNRRDYDQAFSRKMAEQGWVGMTWPKQYGGHERTAFERYVVIEEMLAAGAPVGFHWTADRQSGPNIPALRDRGAEAVLPASHRARRSVVLHRHERARLRIGPCRHADARGEGRWRVPHQRQQAVDVERASRRLHDPVLQDGRGGTGGGRSARRRDAIPY